MFHQLLLLHTNKKACVLPVAVNLLAKWWQSYSDCTVAVAHSTPSKSKNACSWNQATTQIVFLECMLLWAHITLILSDASREGFRSAIARQFVLKTCLVCVWRLRSSVLCCSGFGTSFCPSKNKMLLAQLQYVQIARIIQFKIQYCV